MLQSRPMWARKVAPGGYGAHPSVFQSSKLNPTGQRRSIVCCSSATTKSTTTTLSDQKKPPVSVLRKIRESLVAGEKTAVEITEAYLAKLQEREPHVKSFLHVSGEKAVQDAQELDKRIAEGLGDVGVLAGVPIGVKDNLCTRDMPSTGGSKILRGYCPPFDATAVAKLRSAGAILVGKTNMDEFGMGSSTEGSGYQVSGESYLNLELKSLQIHGRN